MEVGEAERAKLVQQIRINLAGIVLNHTSCYSEGRNPDPDAVLANRLGHGPADIHHDPAPLLQRAAEAVTTLVAACTRALATREYLCAGRFTMADLSVGLALMFAEALGFEHKFSPEVLAYRDRLQSRAGFIAAKASQLAGGDQTDDARR